MDSMSCVRLNFSGDGFPQCSLKRSENDSFEGTFPETNGSVIDVRSGGEMKAVSEVMTRVQNGASRASSALTMPRMILLIGEL